MDLQVTAMATQFIYLYSSSELEKYSPFNQTVETERESSFVSNTALLVYTDAH